VSRPQTAAADATRCGRRRFYYGRRRFYYGRRAPPLLRLQLVLLYNQFVYYRLIIIN